MFNKKLISKVIGSLLILEAAFMLLCVATAIYYHSTDTWPFIISFLITLGTGYGMVRMGWEAPTTMTRRDAFAVVTLTWVTFSFFAAARADISPFAHSEYTARKVSGRSIGFLPRWTPRSFAAAMPSACRCLMNSRSVWAT